MFIDWSNTVMSNLNVLKLKLGLKSGSASGAGNFIGDGSPEGVITAPPGARYFDKLNHADFIKISGTGNTGWQ